MTDHDDRVVAVPLAVDSRPVEDGGKIASTHVARAEAGRDGEYAWDHGAFGGRRVQRRLRFAGERVVGRGWLVGPLDHDHRPSLPEDAAKILGGEGSEGRDGGGPDRSAVAAKDVDDGFRRVVDRAHRDEDLVGVTAAVLPDR